MTDNQDFENSCSVLATLHIAANEPLQRGATLPEMQQDPTQVPRPVTSNDQPGSEQSPPQNQPVEKNKN